MSDSSAQEIKETSERSESSKEMSLNVRTMLDSFITDLHQVSGELQANEATTFTTIHRVPREMREKDQFSTYFVPRYVSIGPVYWGNPELRRGEIDKLKAFRAFVTNHEGILEKIINDVGSSIVTEARKCYQKQLVESLEDETLMRIMVLDGLYVVIAAFLRGSDSPYMNEYRVPDLLKLENQIPYPVLERLFDYVHPSLHRTAKKKLKFEANLYLRFFSHLLGWDSSPPDGPFHHLLHMLHSTLRPQSSDTDDEEEYSCWYWPWRAHYEPTLAERLEVGLRRMLDWRRRSQLQSATQLLEAGVKFKKDDQRRRRRRGSVIDVRFRRGYIEIPRLHLQYTTVTQLLNLVAFEKCMPQCGNHVTAYMAFMNSLVDTAKDVDLLVSSGLLENKLGTSEDVANFFNTAVDDKSEFLKFEMEKNAHYLEGMLGDLGAYCAKPRHRYRAKLERDYLSTPWSVISLIAGTLLLILTVAQTIIAYYSYFRPPKM